MFPSLERLFQHMAWADRQFLSALDGSDERHAPAIKLFAHVVAAEHIWLGRIAQRDLEGFTPWQELSLAECAVVSEVSAKEYLEVVATATDRDLLTPVAYRTTRGDAMETPLGDILLHVALHGSYHRGQIASRLRALDLTVPVTDFVLFSRQFPL